MRKTASGGASTASTTAARMTVVLVAWLLLPGVDEGGTAARPAYRDAPPTSARDTTSATSSAWPIRSARERWGGVACGSMRQRIAPGNAPSLVDH
jgi:hypothetical protein